MSKVLPAKAKNSTVEEAVDDLFSYAMLSREDESIVREAAARIKMRLRRTAEDIIEIGKDLIAVKDRLDHGKFIPWVDSEFSMSTKTAHRFMQVAEVYGDKIVNVTNLGASALYELAAPKTPIEVREEVEKMIEAGEVVTKATVENLKAERAAAEAAKKTALDSAKSLESRNAELSQKIEKIQTAAAKKSHTVNIEEIQAEIEKEVSRKYQARVAELANSVNVGDAEITKLKAEIKALKNGKLVPADDIIGAAPAANVIHPNFRKPEDIEPEDDADVVGEINAIDSFSGSLAALTGLEFSAPAFWARKRQQGKLHAKETYAAVAEVMEKLGTLNKEYGK